MNLFGKIYTVVLLLFAVMATALTVQVIRNRVVETEQFLTEQHRVIGSMATSEIKRWHSQGMWPFEALKTLSEHSDFLFWWIADENDKIYLADKVEYVGTDSGDYFSEIREQLITHDEIGNVVLNKSENYGIFHKPFTVGNERWSFWLGFSTSSIRLAVQELIASTLLYSSIGLVLLGLALYFIIRGFLKPVSDLSRGAQIIGNGNLGHRIRVRSRDEVGVVAEAFNQMAESLQHDIVERERIQQELATSFERLKKILDGIEALIYVADMETYELLFVNEYGRKIWGDIEGQTCWKTLQAGRDAPCDFCTNDRLVDGDGNPAGSYAWEVQNTVTGKWFFIQDRAITWLDGRIVRIEVATDITDKKLTEAEKIKLEEQLRQSYKMEAIGTMAGGIAHDFNNILAIIMSANEMAMEDAPTECKSTYFNEIALKAAHRAKDLVKQILAFSRQSEQESMPVKPCLLLKEDIKLIRSTIPTTVEIRQNIGAPDAFIYADPTQFHQIFINLCTNAVHAMNEKGVLEFTLREVELNRNDLKLKPGLQPGRYIQFSVADNGCGISRDNLERIYDPFFTTKVRGEGTGMGLSVVHGIVESHGGMIRVESEPGLGTTFHVYFPIIDRGEALEMEQPAETPMGNERILYVDDEVMLAEIGGKILERLGYNVTTSFSSTEALEIFKAGPDGFDLVLTDQTMPGMSGVELSAELIKIRPDIPIILCTGYSSKVSDASAHEFGIREFILKPLNRDHLAKTIRKVLDGNNHS